MTPQVGDIWAHDDYLDKHGNHHLLIEDISDAYFLTRGFAARGELSFKTIRLDTGEYDEAYFREANFTGWRKIA